MKISELVAPTTVHSFFYTVIFIAGQGALSSKAMEVAYVTGWDSRLTVSQRTPRCKRG